MHSRRSFPTPSGLAAVARARFDDDFLPVVTLDRDAAVQQRHFHHLWSRWVAEGHSDVLRRILGPRCKAASRDQKYDYPLHYFPRFLILISPLKFSNLYSGPPLPMRIPWKSLLRY